MILNIFDLDKTLIQGDSNELWHEFIKERGFIDEKFIAEDKRLMGLYAEGKLDMDEYLEFALTALKALSLEEISSLMKSFLEEKISPIVHHETYSIIKESKNKIIISATPEFIVKQVGEFLGIKEAIGMRLKTKDGYFTNEYEKPLSYRAGKVECLKLWLKSKNFNPTKTIFYTDSINDLPLCEFADEVHCVNPDAKLETIAHEKKWTIHRWKV